MNMKIFIADDSISDSAQICKQLNNWAECKSAHLKIDCFQELSHDRIAEACGYDVVFLDIELPHINGMEFAKLVRQHNKRIPIVFLRVIGNLLFPVMMCRQCPILSSLVHRLISTTAWTGCTKIKYSRRPHKS